MPKKMTQNDLERLAGDIHIQGHSPQEILALLTPHFEIVEEPTLLEAAKELIEIADSMRWSKESNQAIADLRDAIAREEAN